MMEHVSRLGARSGLVRSARDWRHAECHDFNQRLRRELSALDLSRMGVERGRSGHECKYRTCQPVNRTNAHSLNQFPPGPPHEGEEIYLLRNQSSGRKFICCTREEICLFRTQG